MATPIDPASLRVVDLKEELGKRNLAKTGKKDELVARLKEALAAEEATAAPPTETESAPTKDETSAPLTEQPVATPPTQSELPKAIEQQAQVNDVVETPTLDTSTTETTQPTIEKQTTETTSEIDTSKSSEDSAPSAIPVPQKNDQSQPISSSEADMEADQQPLKRKREESAEDQDDKRTKTESKEPIMETKESLSQGEQNAVCIKGFVRPLITKHLQEFIKQYGDVKRFWIDPIKTHCYIIFDTLDQANNAFQSMNDMVYPPTNTGKQVTAIRLTSMQASQLMDREQQVADHHGRANWEKLLEKVLNNEYIDEPTEQSPTTTKRRLGGLEQITRQLQQRGAVSAIMDQEQAPPPSILDRLSTSTASRLSMPTETPVTIAGIAKKEGKSLDDLFLKTKANPPLYYLPVDKDLAASRLEAAKNKSLE